MSIASIWSKLFLGGDGLNKTSVKGASPQTPERTALFSQDGVFSGGAQTAYSATDPAVTPSHSAGPNSSSAALLRLSQDLRSNQDAINFCYRMGGGSWSGAQSFARTCGVDLNQLVRARQAAVSPQTLIALSGGNGTAASTHATPTPLAPPAPTPPQSQVSTPTRQQAQDSPLARLLQQNPGLRSNQDLINHCYGQGGGTYAGAARVASSYGLDLNALVRNRGGLIDGDGAAASAVVSGAARTAASTATRPGDLSPEQLAQMSPDITLARAREVAPYLNAAMREFGINTDKQRAAFIAQCAHETAGFRYLRELGGESYFQRYEGRRDLGNTQPGDGARFRGRGAIQLTGRYNYRQASRALFGDDRLLSRPEQVEGLDLAFRTAAWYWTSHGLNKKADAGDFGATTVAINGGTNGAGDRQARYDQALDVMVA